MRTLGTGNPEAAVTKASWPARLQRLKEGPLVALTEAEVWLDGGHNASAGQALATALSGLPPRPLHLICGMLNTKDISGYLSPLAQVAETLTAVSIPGETATLPAEVTARAAQDVGLKATTATSVEAALAEMPAGARVLICGSLYLAGHVLRQNA